MMTPFFDGKMKTVKLAIWGVASTFGGIQMLTLRFSEFLKEKEIDFRVITKKNTKIAGLIDQNYQLDVDDAGSCLKEFSHVFFPHLSCLVANVPWHNLLDAKVSFWVVHPTEVFTSFYPGSDRIFSRFGVESAKLLTRVYPQPFTSISESIDLMRRNGSIFCMDGATKRGLEYFFLNKDTEIPIIPIPTEFYDIKINKKKTSDGSSLSMGYFGRLDRFKLSALEPFLRYSIGKIEASRKDLHVIGDGPCADDLARICNDQGINLINYGFRNNSDAVQILSRETDFCAAMGTASLDIAGVGHPCIIINPAHKLGYPEQQSFVFVNEIKNFDLGEFRDFPGYVERGIGIHDVWEQVLTDSCLGQKGLSYVKKHHYSDNIFESLLKSITGAGLKVRNLETNISKIKRCPLHSLRLVSSLV